ncbi:putative P450 monooxygenase [Talaromyces proteolyticus]|uniref:P450 monooxygenase n=1 Tax=Talaromyces proteolyticus TaxID=1131652 RepID=A0AAD4KUI3_9EURO|nr:putative P450 monooxygenase [Talaromyces proteolyticus]KAH8700231.1 putative P450 monooxygenase [Talaromyces proteolyticus]
MLLAICHHSLPAWPLNLILAQLVGANLVLFATYKVVLYPYLLSPLRHLPRLKGGYPLINHALLTFQRPLGDRLLNVHKTVPNNGIILFRGFFNSESLILTSTATLADILVAHPYDFEKPRPGAEFLSRVLGKGLIVVEGDLHKFQRKNIMPSFSFRSIKNLYPIFWSKSVALTERISTETFGVSPTVDGSGAVTGYVDVNFWSSKVTLDMIGIAGLGRDFNVLSNFDDELVEHYDFITDPSSIQNRILFGLWMAGLKSFAKVFLRSHDQNLTRRTNQLRIICKNLIMEKKQSLKAGSEGSKDLLSTLLESNMFSDDDLVDQLLTFLAAGHETTSSTFIWVVYLLSIHKDIQLQLREEIRANIPHNPEANAEFDLAETLESLPLLNAVCNETLRLYPTVPLTSRVAARDTTICDAHIPKGTRIFMSPWAINRSPDLWGADSEEFKPERWIDEKTGKPNKTGGATNNYCVMTFLHGPRSCIGQGFAKGELRALVAAFIGAFDIELENPSYVPVPSGIVTTKPHDGMPLKIKRVGEWASTIIWK